MPRPRLALVPGEPAGVGPELCVRAAQRAWDANLVAFGDPAALQRAAAALDLPLQLVAADATASPGVLPIAPSTRAPALAMRALRSAGCERNFTRRCERSISGSSG